MRLKAAKEKEHNAALQSFNSLKVRLKVNAEHATGKWTNKFQFLKGAIKSIYKGDYLVLSICFNSLKVRLKARTTLIIRESAIAFQFLKGAIKRRIHIGFNGFLSLFQFLKGAIKRLVIHKDMVAYFKFQFLKGAIKSLK